MIWNLLIKKYEMIILIFWINILRSWKLSWTDTTSKFQGFKQKSKFSEHKSLAISLIIHKLS